MFVHDKKINTSSRNAIQITSVWWPLSRARSLPFSSVRHRIEATTVSCCRSTWHALTLSLFTRSLCCSVGVVVLATDVPNNNPNANVWVNWTCKQIFLHQIKAHTDLSLCHSHSDQMQRFYCVNWIWLFMYMFNNIVYLCGKNVRELWEISRRIWREEKKTVNTHSRLWPYESFAKLSENIHCWMQWQFCCWQYQYHILTNISKRWIQLYLAKFRNIREATNNTILLIRSKCK